MVALRPKHIDMRTCKLIVREGKTMAGVNVIRVDRKWSVVRYVWMRGKIRLGDDVVGPVRHLGTGAKSKLDSIKVSISFENASMADILDYLREISGVGITVDPAVQKKVRDHKLTIKVKDLTLKSTLKLLLSQVRLEHTERSDGSVYIHAPGAIVDRGPLTKESAGSLREIRRELDEIRRQIRELTDRLLPSWSQYGVAVDPLSADLKGHLNIKSGIIIRKVKAGSPAEKAGLKPFNIIPGWSEKQLLEALESGKKIPVLRGGSGR